MITRDSTLEQVEALRQTLLWMDKNYRATGNRVTSPEVALGLKALKELKLSLEINGLTQCFVEAADDGSESTN